jgi:hypothetical protein
LEYDSAVELKAGSLGYVDGAASLVPDADVYFSDEVTDSNSPLSKNMHSLRSGRHWIDGTGNNNHTTMADHIDGDAGSGLR